tara:strand:- start:520 stop:1299 length:780 start_codon:yes stop_codon:yes gene_type:complete
MGRSKNPRENFTGNEAITRLPIQPNIPAPPRKGGDIGVGGGPGIPPRFPRGGRRRPQKRGRRMPPREPDFMSGPVTDPGFPSDGPSIMPIPRKRRGGRGRPVGRRMLPRPRPPIDDLGPPPEREVPIPKERLPRITRESDPRGGAPFAPDERGIAKDRFFERMFDRAEEEKQRRSMQKEERREVRQARNEERRVRRAEPGEIDVGGEIDINRRRGRRRRRRDFTRRRSRMEGGRRGRSREERAAFRDRYVSTLGGGFFS